eukprot:scaffold161999_cov90-Attheya_sp.AAC.6
MRECGIISFKSIVDDIYPDELLFSGDQYDQYKLNVSRERTPISRLPVTPVTSSTITRYVPLTPVTYSTIIHYVPYIGTSFTHGRTFMRPFMYMQQEWSKQNNLYLHHCKKE